VTISSIIELHQKLYIFLLTHDNAWLKKMNKAHHVNYMKIKKANSEFLYVQTDKNYCKEIQKAFETLVKNDYERIITRSILLRVAQIARTEAIRKLPKTNKLISKLIETKEQKDRRLNKSTI